MFAKQPTSTGRVFTIVSGVLIFAVVVLDIIAIIGPWWTDTHFHGKGSETVVADIHVTLWNVQVTSKYGKFEDVNLDWEEYCGEKYVNSPTWCHKIYAVRATTILAAIFGLFALVSLIFAVFKNRAWGACTLLCSFLNMSCAICAFSVSIFYSTDSRPAVDTPGFAFILMCVGAMSSLITIMLSLYGLQYKSGLLQTELECDGLVPSGAGHAQSATPLLQVHCVSGEACIIAAGVLVFLGVIMETVAIFGSWWIDTHTHGEGSSKVVGEIDVTLWKVHVNSKHGKFKDLSLDWEEYCGENYVNDESWCHKIRAVRTTTILAVAFGISALMLFARAWATHKRGLGSCAVLSNFVCMFCAICSFSVSIFYPANTRPAVDIPGFAFVLVCLGALFSLIANILACYGLWYKSNSRFKSLESSGDVCKGGAKQDAPVLEDTAPSPNSYGLEICERDLGAI